MTSIKAPIFDKLSISIIVITLFAKGVALFPAYSIDDWIQAPGILSIRQLLYHVLSEGRFGQAAILLLLKQVHVTLYNTYFLGVCLGIVAISLFASLSVRFLQIDGFWPQLIVATLIANHPYTVEMFTWKTVVIFYAIPFLLISFTVVFRPYSLRDFVVSSAVIAAAISLYQPILSFVVVLVLGRWASEALRTKKEDRREPMAFFLLGVSVAGTILYFVLLKITQAILHIEPAGRAAFIALNQLSERIGQATDFYKTFFYKTEHIVPSATKFILVAAVLCGYMALIYFSAKSNNTNKEKLRFVLGQICLGAGIFLSSLSFLLFLSLWWPVPRMLSHAGLVWAGLLLPALHYITGRWTSLGIKVALSLVVLGFITINNAVLVDQIRLNQRDILKANRILADVERLPDYEKVSELCLVGYQPFYRQGISWVLGEMNTSAFYGSFGIFTEIAGIPVNKGSQDEGKALCADKPKWPKIGSVFTHESIAVVCLD